MSTGYTALRARSSVQSRRSEEAKRAIEEQRTIALYHLYRTRQLEVAEMLGLSPGPVLVPNWREYCAE